MVKLRLSRFGHKNAPFYRIVAAVAKSKREGNALEFVGTYNPNADEKNKIVLEKEKILVWLKNGAIPTETVKTLLIREGVLPKTAKVQKVYASKPGKKKQTRAAK